MAIFGDSRLPDRFWQKVRVDSATGCWLWTAGIVRGGYGKFWLDGRDRPAHVVAFEALVGAIVHELDHVCRHAACVRPDAAHLEDVPHAVNLARAPGQVTTVNAEKTHCARGGHPLSGSNLYVDPRGRRECRICRAEATARSRKAA